MPDEPPNGSVRPTIAQVHTAALVNNLRRVQQVTDRASRVLAVVKADAYGHGAREAARILVDAGAWGLAVSLVEEGIELRDDGITAPIVVLGGVPAGFEDLVVQRNLTPVVWAADQLGRLAAAVRRIGAAAANVHLKIDTGMSRLGTLPTDLSPMLDRLVHDFCDDLRLEGVMTHLACADDIADEATSAAQLACFRACLGTIAARELSPSLRHACNSAGLVRFRDAHFDMVRPGIALYGAASAPEVALPGLQLAMSVHSRILSVRRVPAGARVSYGGCVRLERDSRLAIVPVGYADGYARSMSMKACMLVRGHRCPVIGNITMDICMVDVTDLAEVCEGDDVTLLGAQERDAIDVFEMARWAGTVTYEVLCGISKRVPRHHER